MPSGTGPLPLNLLNISPNEYPEASFASIRDCFHTFPLLRTRGTFDLSPILIWKVFGGGAKTGLYNNVTSPMTMKISCPSVQIVYNLLDCDVLFRRYQRSYFRCNSNHLIKSGFLWCRSGARRNYFDERNIKTFDFVPKKASVPFRTAGNAFLRSS